jgi:pyruvate kinase
MLSPMNRSRTHGALDKASDGRSSVSGDLFDEIFELRQQVAAEGQAMFQRWRPELKRIAFRAGALNMAHYLALRKRDMRALQDALIPWGLSSLGRSEARVLANLDAVLISLAGLLGRTDARLPARPRGSAFLLGERLLARHTRCLFGPPRPGRDTHIMVTLPDAAVEDAGVVRALVARGMSCARINCAHGTHANWTAMIRHVREAEEQLGQSCRVLMDLGGPRARTAAIFSREERKLLSGDSLLLRRRPPDPQDMKHPFQAQCFPIAIFPHLAVDTLVALDEGSIRGRVESIDGDGVLLRVTSTPLGGATLKPDKGLNFPGTELGIPALTEKDRDDLDVVVANADLIGYSFVQSPSDIESLWHEVERRIPRTRQPRPGLILKIETELAVRRMPELLVAAAGRTATGAMIARGDLAVEVGFERLAELQEELLWLAEAAHTPVIWATQVLDSFVKKGKASRAEISDVVLAQRAECVMLNKGDFLVEALGIVDDVFRRMDGHQHKKTSRLRALGVWT